MKGSIPGKYGSRRKGIRVREDTEIGEKVMIKKLILL
jgi:hypothetical protein